MSPVLGSAAKELVPLTNPEPLPPVALSPFNRMSLDRKFPFDGTGMEFAPFSTHSPMRYRRKSMPRGGVALPPRLGALGHEHRSPGKTFRHRQQRRAHGASERARRYVVARGDTVRGTHMDVFATFRSYGDYLYVG